MFLEGFPGLSKKRNSYLLLDIHPNNFLGRTLTSFYWIFRLQRLKANKYSQIFVCHKSLVGSTYSTSITQTEEHVLWKLT